MRTSGLIILIIVSCTALSFAQQNKPYFEKGSKAILFEFQGIDNLGANSFNGGIGGKYFLQPKLAIRGGIQFVSINEDVPFQGTNGIDGSNSASQYGIFGAIEFHLDTSQVSPYVGGGLGVTFTSTESKSAEADPVDQVIIKNNRNGVFGYYGGTEFTVFALAGVEVFLIRSLSLGAEYRLGIEQLSRKDEERTVGNTTVTTKQGTRTAIGVASVGVLTLAVYF
jgi:hypothetical protein